MSSSCALSSGVWVSAVAFLWGSYVRPGCYSLHLSFLYSLELFFPGLQPPILSILNFSYSSFWVVLSLDWTLTDTCHLDSIASSLWGQAASLHWDSSGPSHQVSSLLSLSHLIGGLTQPRGFKHHPYAKDTRVYIYSPDRPLTTGWYIQAAHWLFHVHIEGGNKHVQNKHVLTKHVQKQTPHLSSSLSAASRIMATLFSCLRINKQTNKYLRIISNPSVSLTSPYSSYRHNLWITPSTQLLPPASETTPEAPAAGLGPGRLQQPPHWAPGFSHLLQSVPRKTTKVIWFKLSQLPGPHRVGKPIIACLSHQLQLKPLGKIFKN